MRKQICALLVALGMSGSSFAQAADRLQEQFDEISGITYPAASAATQVVLTKMQTEIWSELQAGANLPTGALLREIVTWLAANFDLPAIHDLPRVEFVPPAKLVTIRYKGLVPDRIGNDPAAQTNYQREVIAVYNDSAKTIFLSEGWKGANVADLSVLVHEMVHHLQNLAGLKYECTQAREKLAYQAQDQWLKLHGRDLEKEFEIDMLTLLVSSACMN